MQLRSKEVKIMMRVWAEQKSLEGASLSSMEDHESVAAVSTGATTIETRSGSQAPPFDSQTTDTGNKNSESKQTGKASAEIEWADRAGTSAQIDLVTVSICLSRSSLAGHQRYLSQTPATKDGTNIDKLLDAPVHISSRSKCAP